MLEFVLNKRKSSVSFQEFQVSSSPSKIKFNTKSATSKTKIRGFGVSSSKFCFLPTRLRFTKKKFFPSKVSLLKILLFKKNLLIVCLSIISVQSFMTCIGSRERRTRLAVEHMLPAVVHGGLTTVLSVATLAVSDFDFIVR